MLRCRQVYGAATLNNTLCLGIFLLLVHVRGLRWEFTSEVIVIIGALCARSVCQAIAFTGCLLMGALHQSAGLQTAAYVVSVAGIVAIWWLTFD